MVSYEMYEPSCGTHETPFCGGPSSYLGEIMAQRVCPFCGHVEEDYRTYRTALYIGEERSLVFDPGTATTKELFSIAKKTPNSYLMLEVLDSNGRLWYSRRIMDSELVTNGNGELVRRHEHS